MPVIADFARMPTRQKVIVFVVIGAVLGAIYWQFGYKSLVGDLEAAQNENNSQKALNSKLEKDIPEFEKLKAHMVQLERIIDENQKALPTEAELPAFFETLNRKGLEAGETFVKVPIEYEIQGTYVQIKKFFASLVPKKKKPGEKAEPLPGGEQAVEERERIVSIENLSLTQPVVRNREIRLTAKFTASTYRQEEKKDAAGKPGAAAPAPGSPTPAPAATPKGAKERTEKAIDTGDKRARDGAAAGDAKTPSTGVERMKEGK
jgi:Tfp pilus assembly protein PilO